MRTEDLILISVDDHIVEPPSLARVPQGPRAGEVQGAGPRVIRRDDGTDAWLIEGQEIATFGLNAVQGRPPRELGHRPRQLRPGAAGYATTCTSASAT